MGLAILVLICLNFASEAGAAEVSPFVVREITVSLMSGDQLGASLDGDGVIFKDLSDTASGVLLRYDFGSAATSALPFPPGITAGPDAAGGKVVWQNEELHACLGEMSGTVQCMALPQATSMALSGNRAVSSHDNSVIRLVNFETMRHKILDSSTSSGGRYDPDIEGDQAVWIKERGYAGQYYEPLVVSYDLMTDTLTYISEIGGGAIGGESIYERRHPSLSDSRIVYQQRLRNVAGGWDIYEAIQGGPGSAMVAAPGDQINPSMSGNLVVYQDNRNGHLDGQGNWIGEWDIYLFDRESGREMPVCTAAGDQVNPRIESNRIVWEDSRSGDWDVFAAELTATLAEPRLVLATGSISWGSYEDYLARRLSVRYLISNYGEGPAGSIDVRRVDTLPKTVTLADGLPTTMPLIEAGGTASMVIRYHVPLEVKRFSTSIYVTCFDAAGQELWFPAPPPV